jgi:catecholate siderophore receptor
MRQTKFTPAGSAKLARLLLGTSLSTLGFAPSLAQAQTDTRPEQVIVTAAPYDVEQLSISKFPQPLLDTPQSVNVITGDLLRERGTTNLNDALRNAPGISLGAGEFSWQGNNPTIRGFLARNDMYLDGVRDFGSYYRDTFDYDRVEVLSGPSSVYFGRGSTGGVINQVSKTPFLQSAMTADASLGTDNTKRLTVDYNQPLDELGEGAAVRLAAMAHYANVADRDTGKQRRWGIAPSLALGLGTPTRLTATYLHEDANDIPDYGIPWYFGRPAPVDYKNYYGYDSDYLKTTVDVLTLKVEHDVNSDLQVRNTLRLGQYGRDFRISEGVLAPGTTTSTPLASVQVARNMWQGTSTETQADEQLEATLHFDSWGLAHTLVSGAEATWENSTPLFQNTTGVPTVNLVSPAQHLAYPGTAFSRLYSETPAQSLALYAVDTIKLDPQWEFTAGVRWDQFATNFKSITYANVPNVPQAAPAFLNPPAVAIIKNVDPIVTYRLGLVYKPSENGSIYFAHGTSFDPSAEALSQLTSGRTLGTQNAFLPPEMNQSFELGTKWALFENSLDATVAVFRLEKTNARIPGPVAGVNILGGAQQVDGFELSLSGSITPQWRARAGFSYLDSHTVATATGASLPGSPLVNTPKDAASFWSDYAILPQWSVGLGGQYVSQRLAQNTAASYLTASPYYTLDAASTYDISPNYAIRVNVYNLTDRDYIDEIHPFRAVPGAGRSAMLTLSVKY